MTSANRTSVEIPDKTQTAQRNPETAFSTSSDTFLIKTLITFTKANAQGVEEKHKDEIVFLLDRPSAKMPWYVLRNYLVPKYLTKTYGPFEVAWQRIYEIKILKLINRQNPNDITDIPLRVMTKSQLQAYCQRWEFNVPIGEFFSVEKAREMVALREHDEKGYQLHLAEYREGKQRSYPELDAMRGDKEVVTASISEFDNVDNQIEKLPAGKPISEISKTNKKVSMGELPLAEFAASEDPFAGV